MKEPMVSKRHNVCIKCGQPIIKDVSKIDWRKRGETYGLPSIAWHIECAYKPNNPAYVPLIKESNKKFLAEKYGQHGEQVPEHKEPETATETATGNGGSIGMESLFNVDGLVQILIPRLQGKIGVNMEEINGQIHEALEGLSDELQAMVDAAMGRQLTITKWDGTKVDMGLSHASTEKLCALIDCRFNCYVYGPAGWGKSTAAIKYAKATDKPYGYMSLTPQSQDSKVFGFVDAHGHYVKTTFFDIWTKGGVMVFEEGDQAPVPLMVALNNAMEQRICDFPGQGNLEAHEDTVILLMGNSNLRGPSPKFPERKKADASTVSRLAFLKWDEDREMESAIAAGWSTEYGREWASYVQKVRDLANAEYPLLDVTPRSTYKGIELLVKTPKDVFSVEDVAEMVIFKDFDRDSVKSIVNRIPYPTLKGRN